MKNIIASPLISNGMVIQQNVPFPIRTREKVAVAFLGKTYQAEPDGNGAWRTVLDPAQAGGPYSMEIVSDEGSMRIQDIYLGDVWLCSGQSNMEMLMERVRDDFPGEWDEHEFPPIRQFKVPQEWDFLGPREDFSGGGWIAPSKETLGEFSATAWFFAKNICEKYHVPIGLVATAWGGTPIEAWMSREALAEFPVKIAEGDKFAASSLCADIAERTASGIQEWEAGLNREDLGLAEEWRKPGADISGWETISLPGDFAVAGLVGFCGILWLAREFDIEEDFAAPCASHGAKVWLGTIVDSDTVYINGVEVGTTGYRYPPRKYTVPAGLLRVGTNRIVIRVCCVGGDGGITRDKPFRIFCGNAAVELAGEWKYKIGAHCPPRPPEFFFQRQPMGPFNAMVAPALKFPFKGVIWYQGESNDANSGEYAALFKAMIKDWRKKAGRDDLPFLFVQLPIFGRPSENSESPSWAIIREAQKDALSLPATGMAAALDLGEWNDLHPINKKGIGYRLFLAAEKTVFKNPTSAPGPLLRCIKRQGKKLLLIFDNCGSGLCAAEQPYMAVAANGNLVRCSASIEGPDTVSVDISSSANPEKLLYAWANNPRDRQLFNSDGLPLIPFKAQIPK
jgi:sialate O-acetylesterase